MHSFPVARIVAAATLLAIVPLSAQSTTPKPAKLIGLVRESGSREAIIGAEIQIAQGPGALSNLRGVFVLDSITPGERKVIVRKIGYAPLEITWPFAAGDSVVKIFELETIHTLDSVRTVANVASDPRMAEFEEHRKLGFGKFYTKEDIDKAGGHISNLMAMTNGVRVVNGPAGQAYLVSSRIGKDIRDLDYLHPKCYTEVYLDDALLYTRRTSSNQPPFDINSIPASNIRAIEYYGGVAAVPPKYQKLNLDCGVIVIHTIR
jgi:hypothetical protein